MTFISASAVGYYGDKHAPEVVEEDPPGMGFLCDLCIEWERIPKRLEENGIRCVNTRFGIVLGKGGGALQKMGPLLKMGLGAKLGSGKQYMSWIAIDDLVRAIDHIIFSPSLSGPVNIVTPTPVTNEEFTRILNQVMNRKTIIAIPAFLLKLALGNEASKIYLDSAYVLPKKLQMADFNFKYEDLETTLKKYIT